jgi:hypothetical protein
MNHSKLPMTVADADADADAQHITIDTQHP